MGMKGFADNLFISHFIYKIKLIANTAYTKLHAIRSAVVSETSKPITIPSPMKNSIKPRAFPIIHTALPLWFSIFYAEMPHLNTLTSKITACSFYNQLLDQTRSSSLQNLQFHPRCYLRQVRSGLQSQEPYPEL